MGSNPSNVTSHPLNVAPTVLSPVPVTSATSHLAQISCTESPLIVDTDNKMTEQAFEAMSATNDTDFEINNDSCNLSTTKSVDDRET